MSAIDSFTFLSDNLPSWISKLDLLSHQVSERYTEFTRLSRASGVSVSSIRRKKTGSTESLRPIDADDRLPATPNLETTPEDSPSPVRVEVNPDSKRLFQDFRDQARRKRKSGSITSGVSGPQRFRSRLSLIVYYDSAIQDGFEWLVRSISGARNTLRKGKTAASFKARVASLGMEQSPFGGDRTDISLRNPNLPRFSRSSNPYSTDPSPLEAFDVIDRELEVAQTLCEVGAHQFLRDGSCTEQISGTKERFQSCLSTAQQQVKELKMKEQKERLLEQEQEYARLQEGGTNENGYTNKYTNGLSNRNGYANGSTNGHTNGLAIDNGSIAVDPVTLDLGNGQTIGLAADHSSAAVDPATLDFGNEPIEIDDGEDSNSFHLDLAAFRSTRRIR